MSRRSKRIELEHFAELKRRQCDNLAEQRNSLLDTIDELRNTIATQSTTHGDALRVALEQGERDRQTIADLRAEVAVLEAVAHGRRRVINTLGAARRSAAATIDAMTIVGDRMAQRLPTFAREWDAAKDGRLLRDPSTGRMVSNGGDT